MIDATAAKVRPKYLSIASIRLPLPGFVSFLHRLSGAGLFVALPLLIWALDASLASSDGFAAVQSVAGGPVAKLILLALVWALAHHFFAGIRHLLLDLQAGMELRAARGSAWTVLGLSLALTVLVGVKLW